MLYNYEWVADIKFYLLKALRLDEEGLTWW